MPSRDDIEKLRRHHRLTIWMFVGFWAVALAVIAAIELLALSERTESVLLLLLLAFVVASVALQFSRRCPACGANLGWQVRMGVPDACRRCGADLKTPED